MMDEYISVDKTLYDAMLIFNNLRGKLGDKWDIYAEKNTVCLTYEKSKLIISIHAIHEIFNIDNEEIKKLRRNQYENFIGYVNNMAIWILGSIIPDMSTRLNDNILAYAMRLIEDMAEYSWYGKSTGILIIGTNCLKMQYGRFTKEKTNLWIIAKYDDYGSLINIDFKIKHKSGKNLVTLEKYTPSYPDDNKVIEIAERIHKTFNELEPLKIVDHPVNNIQCINVRMLGIVSKDNYLILDDISNPDSDSWCMLRVAYILYKEKNNKIYNLGNIKNVKIIYRDNEYYIVKGEKNLRIVNKMAESILFPKEFGDRIDSAIQEWITYNTDYS